MLSDSIIILLIGSITGLIGLCLKLAYSSKCTKCKFGCVEVDRDTNNETRINIDAMQSPNRI